MAGASLVLHAGWPGYGRSYHRPVSQSRKCLYHPSTRYPSMVQEQPFQQDAARAGWGLRACWNHPGTLTVIYGGLSQSTAQQKLCYTTLMNRSSLFSSCWHDWTNFPVCFLHQDVWSLKNNYISSVMSYRWSSRESNKRKQEKSI